MKTEDLNNYILVAIATKKKEFSSNFFNVKQNKKTKSLLLSTSCDDGSYGRSNRILLTYLHTLLCIFH